jgi:hypothetical protein
MLRRYESGIYIRWSGNLGVRRALFDGFVVFSTEISVKHEDPNKKKGKEKERKKTN